MILKLRNLGEIEDFCEWEVHEVTFHLNGNVEITDKSTLEWIERKIIADIHSAFLVDANDEWVLIIYLNEIDGWIDLQDDIILLDIIN